MVPASRSPLWLGVAPHDSLQSAEQTVLHGPCRTGWLLYTVQQCLAHGFTHGGPTAWVTVDSKM